MTSRGGVFFLQLLYLAGLGALAGLYFEDVLIHRTLLGTMPIAVPWWGALGAVTLSLTGVFEHRGTWQRSYAYWHWARPFIGVVLASFAVRGRLHRRLGFRAHPHRARERRRHRTSHPHAQRRDKPQQPVHLHLGGLPAFLHLRRLRTEDRRLVTAEGGRVCVGRDDLVLAVKLERRLIPGAERLSGVTREMQEDASSIDSDRHA